VWSAPQRVAARTPKGAVLIMEVFAWPLAVCTVTVVALVLGFAGFIVRRTGSTDGLDAVGKMVTLILEAVGKMVAQIITALRGG
jgi:hypothetical protein